MPRVIECMDYEVDEMKARIAELEALLRDVLAAFDGKKLAQEKLTGRPFQSAMAERIRAALQNSTEST